MSPASATVSTSAFGWVAMIGAYSLIKGAYSGYEAPVYFTEENEQPASSIPRALAIGLGVTAFLYISVNAALLYALGPHGTAATPLPFTTVLDRIGGSWTGILFAIGAMISVVGVANAIVMSAPRLIFALARDGLLPEALCSVNQAAARRTWPCCSRPWASHRAGGHRLLRAGVRPHRADGHGGPVLIDGSIFMLRRQGARSAAALPRLRLSLAARASCWSWM